MPLNPRGAPSAIRSEKARLLPSSLRHFSPSQCDPEPCFLEEPWAVCNGILVLAVVAQINDTFSVPPSLSPIRRRKGSVPYLF